MFIETHSDENISLTFIKSANVQAYPCGRRRSTLVNENDGNSNNDFYFPFDPEARLNTEANNRKHSSLNGYTQTYLKDWDDKKLISLALEGYLFNISLAATAHDFGNKVIEQLADADASSIYANILIEDVHLFSGFQEYYTSVLRNQSADDLETSLDLLKTEVKNSNNYSEMQNFDNYYFSGLSFSTEPLVCKASEWKSGDNFVTRASVPNIVKNEEGKVLKRQVITSLKLLEKDADTWKIHQPALLPKIEHGETDDSIVVTGNALMKSTLTVKDKATIKEAEITDKTTITGELVVENDNPAEAKLANAMVTGILKVSNDTKTAEIVADNAGIDTLLAGTIGDTETPVEKIIASDIQQKIGDDFYDVPVIFLEPKTEGTKTFYQLQISRVNQKN